MPRLILKGEKVRISIEPQSGDQGVVHGRNFDSSIPLISKLTRHSIDALKLHFRCVFTNLDLHVYMHMSAHVSTHASAHMSMRDTCGGRDVLTMDDWRLVIRLKAAFEIDDPPHVHSRHVAASKPGTV